MDNLKDTLSNAARSAYKTSKGFLKTTKLSMDIGSEESNLKAIYQEIGKKVHEIYAYGGSLGKFFDEKYQELLRCEQKIDILRKRLDEAKGTKTCPKCGKSSHSSSEFCPKCGANMNDGVDSFAFSPPPPEPEPQDRFPPPEPRDYLPPPEPRDYLPPPEPRDYLPPPEPQDHFPPPETPDDYYTHAPSRKCPVCGKENDPGYKFCYSCGRFL